MDKLNYSEELIEKAKKLSEECLDCGLCIDECEMLRHFKIRPKEFFGTGVQAIDENTKIPYSCNLCKNCTRVCSSGLELHDIFKDMRKELVRYNNGKSPIKGHSSIEFHQKFSFSKMFNTSIPDSKAGYTKRVFIPGCSLSSYSPELVGKTIDYLQDRLPGTGAVLKCCGNPTLSLGQEEKFKERYAELQQEIDRLGVEEVITACQNCYVTISNYSPNVKVRSLWTVIPEIGLSDEMIDKGRDSEINFTIHDACPTRYNSDILDGIRWIVENLGYKYTESEYSREQTRCCGFGGMVVPADRGFSQKVINRAADAGTDHMITYCASCREAMVMGGKKALHILDLMFNDRYDTNSTTPELNKSFIENWTKRYRSRKVIENIDKRGYKRNL